MTKKTHEDTVGRVLASPRNWIKNKKCDDFYKGQGKKALVHAFVTGFFKTSKSSKDDEISVTVLEFEHKMTVPRKIFAQWQLCWDYHCLWINST